MPLEIHQNYLDQKTEIENIIQNYSSTGKILVEGSRNTIKIFQISIEKLSVKYFKKPGFIKGIIYSFFRKSKAKRSYEYANYLLQHTIKTPFPIAYFEERNAIGFLGESFYVCNHIDYDFTIRELIHDPLFPERDEIIRQFTAFTFLLHEARVNFLDHSPGNTLIKKIADNQYEFYLIDLNRMKFQDMNLELRMDNFKKMWLSKKMLQVVAKKYAELYGKPESELLPILMKTSEDFKRKINKKKWLKRKMGKR